MNNPPPLPPFGWCLSENTPPPPPPPIQQHSAKKQTLIVMNKLFCSDLFWFYPANATGKFRFAWLTPFTWNASEHFAAVKLSSPVENPPRSTPELG